MNVQIKSSNGITLVPVESRLMADRKIFIEGEINADNALEFMKKIMFLNSEDSSKTIDVLMNSSGGDMNAGMLMYDVMQSSKAPIRMFCTGRAYGIGAVLFACAKQRYMLPHSELMICFSVEERERQMGYVSVKSGFDSLSEPRIKLKQILVGHIGKTEDEVEQVVGLSHYFTPEECMKFGLCDQIAEFSMIMEG